MQNALLAHVPYTFTNQEWPCYQQEATKKAERAIKSNKIDLCITPQFTSLDSEYNSESVFYSAF